MIVAICFIQLTYASAFSSNKERFVNVNVSQVISVRNINGEARLSMNGSNEYIDVKETTDQVMQKIKTECSAK